MPVVAAFSFLAPILEYFNFSLFDKENIKFFMDITEAACNIRYEDGGDAAKVRYHSSCKFHGELIFFFKMFTESWFSSEQITPKSGLNIVVVSVCLVVHLYLFR